MDLDSTHPTITFEGLRLELEGKYGGQIEEVPKMCTDVSKAQLIADESPSKIVNDVPKSGNVPVFEPLSENSSDYESAASTKSSSTQSVDEIHLHDSVLTTPQSPNMLTHALKTVKSFFSPDKRCKPVLSSTPTSKLSDGDIAPTESPHNTSLESPDKLNNSASSSEDMQPISKECTDLIVGHESKKGTDLNISVLSARLSSLSIDNHNDTDDSFTSTVSRIDDSFQSTVTHIDDYGQFKLHTGPENTLIIPFANFNESHENTLENTLMKDISLNVSGYGEDPLHLDNKADDTKPIAGVSVNQEMEVAALLHSQTKALLEHELKLQAEEPSDANLSNIPISGNSVDFKELSQDCIQQLNETYVTNIDWPETAEVLPHDTTIKIKEPSVGNALSEEGSQTFEKINVDVEDNERTETFFVNPAPSGKETVKLEDLEISAAMHLEDPSREHLKESENPLESQQFVTDSLNQGSYLPPLPEEIEPVASDGNINRQDCTVESSDNLTEAELVKTSLEILKNVQSYGDSKEIGSENDLKFSSDTQELGTNKTQLSLEVSSGNIGSSEPSNSKFETPPDTSLQSSETFLSEANRSESKIEGSKLVLDWFDYYRGKNPNFPEHCELTDEETLALIEKLSMSMITPSDVMIKKSGALGLAIKNADSKSEKQMVLGNETGKLEDQSPSEMDATYNLGAEVIKDSTGNNDLENKSAKVTAPVYKEEESSEVFAPESHSNITISGPSGGNDTDSISISSKTKILYEQLSTSKFNEVTESCLNLEARPSEVETMEYPKEVPSNISYVVADSVEAIQNRTESNSTFDISDTSLAGKNIVVDGYAAIKDQTINMDNFQLEGSLGKPATENENITFEKIPENVSRNDIATTNPPTMILKEDIANESLKNQDPYSPVSDIIIKKSSINSSMKEMLNNTYDKTFSSSSDVHNAGMNVSYDCLSFSDSFTNLSTNVPKITSTVPEETSREEIEGNSVQESNKKIKSPEKEIRTTEVTPNQSGDISVDRQIVVTPEVEKSFSKALLPNQTTVQTSTPCGLIPLSDRLLDSEKEGFSPIVNTECLAPEMENTTQVITEEPRALGITVGKSLSESELGQNTFSEGGDSKDKNIISRNTLVSNNSRVGDIGRNTAEETSFKFDEVSMCKEGELGFVFENNRVLIEYDNVTAMNLQNMGTLASRQGSIACDNKENYIPETVPKVNRYTPSKNDKFCGTILSESLGKGDNFKTEELISNFNKLKLDDSIKLVESEEKDNVNTSVVSHRGKSNDDFLIENIDQAVLLDDKLDSPLKCEKGETEVELAQFIQQQFTVADIEKICSVVEDPAVVNLNRQILRASHEFERSYHEKNIEKSLSTIDEFFNVKADSISDHSFDFLDAIQGKNTARDLSRESLYVKFDPLVEAPKEVEGLIDFSKNVSDNVNCHQINCNEPLIVTATPKQPVNVVAPLTPPCSVAKKEPKIQDGKIKDMLQEIERLKDLYQQREEVNRVKLDDYENQIAKLMGHNCVLEDRLRESQEREKSLVRKLKEQSQGENRLRVCMEDYLQLIEILSKELETTRTSNKKELATLMSERDSYMNHLQNTEAAFSDVHTKYEKSKKVVESYRKNEDSYKRVLDEQTNKIEEYQDKLKEVQEKAARDKSRFEVDLEEMKKHHVEENSRLRAQLRKVELKLQGVQGLLDQKNKENQELTVICDDLISGKK